MKRFALERLKEWKEKPNRKPLIIRGARQVGKTWLMKEFGKTFFEKVAYVNFDSNTRMQQVFDGEINIERIVLAISAETGISVNPENTLLIFDEVQEVPRALTSLKYFCENNVKYNILAAGSLLGVATHEGTGFPVGKVDFVDLYPLNFVEFANAMGEEQLTGLIEKKDYKMISIFKNRFENLLKQYCYIGGMPAVVMNFIKNKDFSKVRAKQKSILNSYEEDFSKHIPSGTVEKTRLLWKSIPAQLSKENKKFIYGVVKDGARAKDLENAMSWLLDSGLIYKLNRISKPDLPLIAYEDFNAFKLFVLDVGLLGAMTNLKAKTMIEGNKIFEEFKGTGNMEVHLDRKLSEKRIFPAIDINKSGTRREELLLTPKELEIVFALRKAMSTMSVADVTEELIIQMVATKNNNEFLDKMSYFLKNSK